MAKNTILNAARKAGVPVTPEFVDALKMRLLMKVAVGEGSPQIETVLSDIDKLAGMMFALSTLPGKQKTKPTKKAGWDKRIKEPLSDAARAAVHDKIQAARRPGGKMKRRPRWAPDKEPISGWEDGTTPVRHRPEPKAAVPEAIVTDATGNLALVLAALRSKRPQSTRTTPTKATPTKPTINVAAGSPLAQVLAALKPAAKPKVKRRRYVYR
jgi:hypothetical protein